MTRTRVLTVGVAALLAAGLGTPAASAHPVAGVTHQLPIAAAVRHDIAYTANWSGYVVTPPSGQKITAVHTSFVVPRANTSTPGGASTWAGIGGWTSNDLIQAGVEEGNLGGPVYYAWYEILPQSETLATNCTGDPNCTVNPGDLVRVDIVQKSAQLWNVSLADVGHWSMTKSVSYASSGSSAEWILEAPTTELLGLIATTTVMPFMANTTFGPGNTYALGGHAPVRMGRGQPTQVNMLLDGLVPEAAASPVAADGDGFTGCTFQGNCPPPTK
jgi:hypothetical protein